MKIAIWLQGGIGGGNFSQGYPPLLDYVFSVAETHDVTVYSILPANDDFKPERFSFRTWNGKNSNLRIRAIMLGLIFIKDHLKKRFDIIHAFWVYPAGSFVVLLGKLFNLPSMVTVQGGEAAAIKEIGYGNMLKPWLKRVTLYTCEKATCLNTISQFLVDQMIIHGLRRRDAIVIPFGANTRRFPFVKKRIGGVLKLIHVANLTEVKDQETLLKAFSIIVKQIPAELRILGADYMNGQIHRLAADLGIVDHVKFLGAFPQHELTRHYAWADIMLHTSLHEGQSGVVMEAMASGVVVCATPVGIVYDLNTEFFKVAPIKDFNSMANEVLALHNHPEEFEMLSGKAHERAKEFDLRWTVSEFNKVYQSLIK